MSTILLVEDDKNSGYLIQRNLVQAGYEVILAKDGEAALQHFSASAVDLCILDIMLPKKDGLTVAREIKKQEPCVPFIFLSARTLDEDKIEGFKTGCDDYITKPFNLEELLLRIKVVLKRNQPENMSSEIREPVTIGNAIFDLQERTLGIGKEKLNLSSKEADLFKVLLLNRNDVLSRSQILTQVWGKDDYYASKSLDVYLTRIRKMMKKIEGAELQNIHGYGYKFLVSR